MKFVQRLLHATKQVGCLRIPVENMCDERQKGARRSCRCLCHPRCDEEVNENLLTIHIKRYQPRYAVAMWRVAPVIFTNYVAYHIIQRLPYASRIRNKYVYQQHALLPLVASKNLNYLNFIFDLCANMCSPCCYNDDFFLLSCNCRLYARIIC